MTAGRRGWSTPVAAARTSLHRERSGQRRPGKHSSGSIQFPLSAGRKRTSPVQRSRRKRLSTGRQPTGILSRLRYRRGGQGGRQGRRRGRRSDGREGGFCEGLLGPRNAVLGECGLDGRSSLGKAEERNRRKGCRFRH